MKNNSILIVDDEEIILRTFHLDLKDAGYEVETASCGEAALKKLEDDDYNLVITDLVMEGLDGIKILKWVKKNRPETAVIILTGYGSLTSAIDALRLGASDYVLKPYNKMEMLHRVSSCLEKQELLRKVELYENMIPMCSVCKKIRDDSGSKPGEGVWVEADAYIESASNIAVSRIYCNDCYENKKEGIYLEKQKSAQEARQLAK